MSFSELPNLKNVHLNTLLVIIATSGGEFWAKIDLIAAILNFLPNISRYNVIINFSDFLDQKYVHLDTLFVTVAKSEAEI